MYVCVALPTLVVVWSIALGLGVSPDNTIILRVKPWPVNNDLSWEDMWSYRHIMINNQNIVPMVPVERINIILLVESESLLRVRAPT